MTTYTATATSKGQIVIPAALRRRYGIKPGTRVRLLDLGDRIVLVPLNEAYYRQLRGSLEAGGALAALEELRSQERQR